MGAAEPVVRGGGLAGTARSRGCRAFIPYLHAASNLPADANPYIRAGAVKLTVTFLRWVKLSSIPSNENSRPIPLCL